MSSENLGGEYPDILTTHDYDGIQEYDNPMPFWWKAIFVLTVIWGVGYVVAIEMGFVNTYGGDLAAEQEALAAVRSKQQKDLPPVDDKLLLAAVGDEGKIADGEKVYASTCASCHGQKGEGLIGPNLTDKFWIHGGDIASVHNVIVNGVAAKGMPPWGAVIGREGAINVTAFLQSKLRGTNIEGKEAQGEPYVEGDTEEVEPTDAAAPADAPAEEPPAEKVAE